MLPSGNNLSALFRTLAPEEPDFQDTAKAVTPDARQEWPLFQVVTPTKPEPTPPLTPQERKRWGVQAAVRVESSKPALSMSGLSSKLAQSLNQISERMTPEAPQPSESATISEEPPLSKPTQRVTVPVSPPKASISLFSKAPLATEFEIQEERSNIVGLFEKPMLQSTLTTDPGAEKTKVDDSLSSIFNRMSSSGKVTVKPVEKRSSLSTRLGKR